MTDKRDGAEGLWDGVTRMEQSTALLLSGLLAMFEEPIQKCYELGVQAPTLKATQHHEIHMRLAALFLKRALTDLRGVWLLLKAGYTSQSASVAASLFEHALSVSTLASFPEKAQALLKSPSGDLPWSPLELSKNLAEQFRKGAAQKSEAFSNNDYEQAYRNVYATYKFLCKIKHPTLRSTVHDSRNTKSQLEQYVVMATPDITTEDIPLKAVVLTTSISRCLEAIRSFTEALDCDQSDPTYQRFENRMQEVSPKLREAFAMLTSQPLPFNISDEEEKLFKNRQVKKRK